MKRTTLAILMLAFCLPVIAQSGPTLIANIPFNFELGDKVMPAGEYQLKLTTSWYPAILLTSTDMQQSMYVLSGIPGTSRNSTGRTFLSFNRYEDRNFLANVYFLDRNCPVMKSKSERALVTSKLVKAASVRPVEVRIMAAVR